MKRRRSAPTRSRRWVAGTVVFALVLVVLALGFSMIVSEINAPPRSLARYVQQRISGHGELLQSMGEEVAHMLTRADRGEPRAALALKLRAGAQTEVAATAGTPSNVVPVSSVDQALQAIDTAKPGDVITFQPGTYRFTDDNIAVRRAGTKDSPIRVRAERPDSVILEMQISEGFLVSAPYWQFENLTIRGVCPRHADCEHAFHVVGGASNFIARNNVLRDFNAHIKVNGREKRFPDNGLVEGNSITDTVPRQTDKPVAPIDLVGASNWVIRGNLIADFVKAQGDRISYGAFAKGGGANTRFEGNVILCEHWLRSSPGVRVGLSLGGGGTGREFCRDGACITEQSAGVIESNLIASCSDDGVYINRSAGSRVQHNTLLDTGGITVRFPQSSAEIEGNIVDGAIRSRDDGVVHADDNLQTSLVQLYLGRHGLRTLYRDSPVLDLAWAKPPKRRVSASNASRDLCGSTRPTQPAYGAFEDFAACIGAGASTSPKP